MSDIKRVGKRWTISECLQLQREYELLKLPLFTIASRHQRTVNAIMYKLDSEGFADYNTLYMEYYNCVPTSSSVTSEQNADYFVDDESIEELYSDDEMNSPSNLRQQMMRLEAQLVALTDLLIQQSKQFKQTNSATLNY
jgi:hypothetical protein